MLIDGDAFHGMPSKPEHISNPVLWPPTGMRTFYQGAKPGVRQGLPGWFVGALGGACTSARLSAHSRPT